MLALVRKAGQGGQKEASQHPCGNLTLIGGCTPCVLLLCTCMAGPQDYSKIAKTA